MTTQNNSLKSLKIKEWVPIETADEFLDCKLHCSGAGSEQFEIGQQPLEDVAFFNIAKKDYLLLNVTEGSLDLYLGQSFITLEAGFLLIAEPGAFIKIENAKISGKCFFTFVGGDIADIYLKQISELSGNIFYFADNRFLSEQILQLINSFYLGIIIDECFGSLFAYKILISIYQFLILNASNDQVFSSLIIESINIIKEEYAYLYGIDELSDRLQVSKSHLIRLFTKQVGTSPGKYLASVRIENAKLFLSTGDYPVETVANMVGYSDSNYFCKVFKKQTGLTPKQFAHANPTKHLAVNNFNAGEGFVY